MALTTTTTTEEWHVLVEIALDSGTLYIADDDLVFDNGTVYDGALLSIPSLSLSIGQILDPRIVSPSLSISLRDADDTYRNSHDAEEWGNRAVVIKVGQGLTIADYTEQPFVGVVRFPTGVAWDANVFTFGVDDLRSKDSKVLPTSRFNPATYANMETKSQYKAIPLIFGDWRVAAGGGEKVPAFQIDSTAGTGGKFKLSSVTIKEIEKVWIRTSGGAWSDITANCSLDLTNAEFTITSGTYDPDTNDVACNIQGHTANGASGGTLLQTFGTVYNDILQTHLGVSSGNIDSAAVTAWDAELEADDYVRRHIGSETNSDDLIRDLLVGGFADQTIEAGKYKPVYRIVDTSASAPALDTANIRERSDATADFTVAKDPEGVFVNEVVGDYRYDPVSAGYLATFENSNAASISTLGTTKRRRLSFSWGYIAAGVERRTSRELYMFGKQPEVATLLVDPEGLVLGPTERFDLTHDKYDDVPWQVRDVVYDLTGKTARLTCFNMLRLTPGRWTGSTAPAWASATRAQQLEQGFWTNASGRADAADADSTGSVWF